MHKAFEKIPFTEPDQAERTLELLCAKGGDTFAAHLAQALEESPHPTKALIRLEHYFEEAPDPAQELRRMAEDLQYTRLAVTLFGQSHFLTNIVSREPELLPWLWSGAERKRARTSDEILGELWAVLEQEGPYERCCRAMRIFRRREIARIALRDIFEHAPVPSITLDLSNLADAMLEAAYRISRAETLGRYGRPMSADAEGREHEAAFVVLGMGKLGGHELNFSSDIDLLFFYSDEGETTGDGGRSVTNEQYFRKLGELLIKAISEQTVEGDVFRVDMRLRPFGSTGPLAVSLDVALDYYTTYGRAWERQALIKARPCAGDLELGERFLERMRPFVFPRFFDDRTLEDIRETKRQAEAQIAQRGETEREVKLGRGGIRDIEFTVQMLQLLNGGAFPDLRTTNTLEAIEMLGRFTRLSPFEVDTLSRHYVFLRTVEHRLQIEGGLQCHALPSDPESLDEFARRLGYVDGNSFMNTYRDRAEETRAILDRFLASKGAGNLWVGDLLNPRSDAEAGIARLSDLGFRDPGRAREQLLLLCAGPSDHPHTMHVRQDFAEIAPDLIRALAESTDPDRTLVRIAGMLPRLQAPGALYQVLRSTPILSRYLVRIASNSEYLTTMLVRDPGLFDVLANPETLRKPATREELREDLRFLANAVDPDAALYRMRDSATLRVGLRETAGGISLAEVGDELTLIAEVILERALNEAREKAAARYGACDTPFAILGLGKLGGWEMGYGSDLDLVFVYPSDGQGPDGMSAQEYFISVASRTVNRLTEHTPHGVLYDIDARLRPDGNKGMLAVGHDRLAEYYRNEAQAWERLALMKARAAGGDMHFAFQIERMAKELAFSLPLNRETLEQVDSLRRKHAEGAGPLDLKKTEGGINEVEFAVRLWQLRFVRELPELKRGDVFGALDILRENEMVDPAENAVLYEAYGQLRRILNRIRMMYGGHETELPADPETRAELAARLEIDGDIVAFVRAHQERVHQVYAKTYAELWENA